MYILGISETDNDAGAVLLHGPSVVCGVNEERFSRIKRHAGFPYQSIEWILRSNKLSLEDIDYIAIAKADPLETPERFYRQQTLLRQYPYVRQNGFSSLSSNLLNYLIHHYRNIPKAVKLATGLSKEIADWCQQHVNREKVIRVPHHYAHAVCAYWASGFEDALAVTLDGQGEGVTSAVYRVKNGQFTLLKEVLVPHSLGVFYAAVTKALGFKPARHEGKITGLAAYGDPPPELLREIERLAYVDQEGGFAAPCVYGNYPHILKFAKQYGRKNISAAFQLTLEKVATAYIRQYVEQEQCRNIVLAGGVFANVKLNQSIHHIDGLKDVFVFPHMADGGLGYGAAQHVYREKTGDKTHTPIRDVYWGPGYSQQEIESALQQSKLNYQHRGETIVQDIVDLLQQNKVVAHFNGRMEFGPRALGNRSILYPTTDPSVNEWLNEHLHRSEFMPFAPVTLAEKARECYPDIGGAEFTCEFMTITCHCTPKMRKQSPAVVHVDGTARPQLTSEAKNPRYYNILKEYYKRTNIPSLVNTSFNMHEEPIVCSPNDAIRSFLNGNLDALSIGDFLVRKEG